MKKFIEIDVMRVRELFIYEPATGLLKRRVDRPRSPTGTVVGTRFSTGHLNVSVDGRMTGVHRIAWALHYGESPRLRIDHINGDGADNRLCNLRLATHSQNCRNARIGKRNKSGIKNVFRVKWSNRVTKTVKWRVAIGCGSDYAITHFDCLGQAVAHAKQSRISRHGEFANNGHSPVGAI